MEYSFKEMDFLINVNRIYQGLGRYFEEGMDVLFNL
jgi:hypothetical protein